MNSGMHDRLSENWFRENQIIFKNIYYYKNIFQGPNNYTEQICELYLSPKSIIGQNSRVFGGLTFV